LNATDGVNDYIMTDGHCTNFQLATEPLNLFGLSVY